jgi:hypothetical protein
MTKVMDDYIFAWLLGAGVTRYHIGPGFFLARGLKDGVVHTPMQLVV